MAAREKVIRSVSLDTPVTEVVQPVTLPDANPVDVNKLETVIETASDTIEQTQSEKDAELAALVEAAKAPADVTIGSNKAPEIVSYKPMMSDKAHAIQAVAGIFRDMRTDTEKLGSKFDQLALMITDFAYFLWEESKTVDHPLGKVPSHRDLKASVKSIMDGMTYAKKVKVEGVETLREMHAVKTNEQKAAEAKEKKALPQGLKDQSLTFQTVADATFQQYLDPACRAARLVLYGSETVAGLEGTTYRKGYRYLTRGVGHLAGDVILVNNGTEKQPKLAPYSMDLEKPEDAYLGIIFHDHSIHPQVEISRKTDGSIIYQPRHEIPKYARKPWLGLTRQGVDKDFERFFGKDGPGGTTIKVEIDLMTGYEVTEKRATGGTQSEGNSTASNTTQTTTQSTPASSDATTAETPALPKDIRDVPKENRLPLLQGILDFVNSLSGREAAYTTDEMDVLSDIHAKLNAIIEGINGEDNEQIKRAMGE